MRSTPSNVIPPKLAGEVTIIIVPKEIGGSASDPLPTTRGRWSYEAKYCRARPFLPWFHYREVKIDRKILGISLLRTNSGDRASLTSWKTNRL